MATGRLGTVAPSATTLAQAYGVPAGYYSVFNISVTNTNATSVTIRIALSTSNTAPAANEYIEYETTIVGRGVFERTGIVADAGKYVMVYASSTLVNFNVWGIETSTT
jgi:hypothetical protein